MQAIDADPLELTRELIEERTRDYLAVHDMEALLAQIERCLKNDQWACDNLEFMIEQCPKTYAQWERGDCFLTVSMLGVRFNELNVLQKSLLLQGHGATAAQRRMRELLVQDGTLWEELSPAWIGGSQSLLRKCAESLGWEPRFLIEMTSDGLDLGNTDIPAWSNVFLYPYSVFAVYYLLRNENEFLSSCQVECTLHCREGANALDIALAQCLMKHNTQEVAYKLTPHSSTDTIDTHALTQLQAMVDVCVQLGGLEALGQSLANDVFPGFSVGQDMDLPTLDML